MKTGRSLQELAIELERQAASKKDYIAAQDSLTAIVDDSSAAGGKGEIKIAGLNGDPLSLTGHAHGQLSDHLGIPKKYYDRMAAEQPELLAQNLNTWLHSNGAEQRMIRTLDTRIRGFLSPQYRPLDSYDLAQVALPTLMEAGAAVMSAELTDTRLYIKATIPELCDDLPEGLTWGTGHNAVAEYAGNRAGKIVSAIVISNSDVGAGALRVEPSVFTTWCTNLAIMAQAAMKKYHVGKAFTADDDLTVFRDATRQADDRAFWLKVQDIVRHGLSRDAFQAAIEQIRNGGTAPIVSQDLPKVVEVTVKRLGLPEGIRGGLLTRLAQGGDLTRWGLSSAITAVANDYGDYEGATELERAGGKVLALQGKDWEVISGAVAQAA